MSRRGEVGSEGRIQGGEKVHAPALGDQLQTEILLPSESARYIANVIWDHLAPIVSQPGLNLI
jgi:hypothetical protein